MARNYSAWLAKALSFRWIGKGVARASSASRDPSIAARRALCELLRTFYDKEWISGTGGGICSRLSPDELLLAPSGVHKERVRPGDFFVVSLRDGRVVVRPKNPRLKPSECGPIFRAIICRRNAGSVIHSHALSAVLAADLAEADGRLVLGGFEMLKGIRGGSNRAVHVLPVIENTPEEPQLTAQAEVALRSPEFAAAYGILVLDHGAYIWGADIWEAKRHAEVYHFLFEGVVARRKYVEVGR